MPYVSCKRIAEDGLECAAFLGATSIKDRGKRRSIVLHLPTVDSFSEAQQTFGNPAGMVRQAGSCGGIVRLTHYILHKSHAACADCVKVKFSGVRHLSASMHPSGISGKVEDVSQSYSSEPDSSLLLISHCFVL